MVRGNDADGPVRVAAVDDHVPVRRGLAAMLGDSDDVVVVTTAGSATAAVPDAAERAQRMWLRAVRYGAGSWSMASP